MGNQESFGYDRDDDRFDGIDTLGYRVLGVQPNSPASSAGLVSFFDFLVGCDGRMLLGRSIDDDGNEIGEEEEEYDDIDFPALLRDNVGKELEMLVWNIKSQTQRFVKIVPSSSWGGTGLLGVTIRLDDYAEADERLIRVLSIEHNSPAAIAGLEPLTDYLLGTTTVSFDDDASLAHVLRQHVDRVVELYVYNTESDVVRVVTLMPTLSWGGAGLLGAEVGTGYLHRLPRHCRGTGGSSVERKVRTGARVQPAAAANSASAAANPGASAAEAAPDANGGDDAVLSREEAGLVDLTASVNGGEQDTEIHLEPQLEFEPDPESPMSHHRAAVTVAGLQAEAPLVKLESSESEPAPVPAPAPEPEPQPEQPESVPASAPEPEPEPEQTPAEEPPNQSEKADVVVTQETQEPSEESGGSGKGAASVNSDAEPPVEQQQQSASSASSEQQAPPAPAADPSVPPPPPPPPPAAATAEAAFSAPPPPPAAPPKETAVPPPPPPPPAADAAAAFSAPPPPPPAAAAAPQMPAPPPGAAPFAMPPPPSFGETISYGGGPIPPPPPPPPGAYGAYGGGLPPPPIANVADSPEKGQGEVDLR